MEITRVNLFISWDSRGDGSMVIIRFIQIILSFEKSSTTVLSTGFKTYITRCRPSKRRRCAPDGAC